MRRNKNIMIHGKAAMFIGGALFGSAGLRILGSRDAKKVYTHITAAVLRCKDQIVSDVETIQENCADILADAKAINEARAAEEKEKIIEDTAPAPEAKDEISDNA